MRKNIMGFIIAGVLALVFGLASTPVQAELSLGLEGGYYSPSFGKVNDESLGRINRYYSTGLEFQEGMVYGLALGYGLGPHFGLRLEYNSFESKTSGDYYYAYGTYMASGDIELKLTVTSVVFSGIYKLSPFYIAVGVGSFPTKITGIWVEDGIYSEGYSDSDSPIGLVLLAGFEFGDRPIFLNLEARYVVGTKAKLKHLYPVWPEGPVSPLETEVDLSGLQFNLLIGFRFK